MQNVTQKQISLLSKPTNQSTSLSNLKQHHQPPTPIPDKTEKNKNKKTPFNRP